MKIGDKVKVYDKPITSEELEGIARIATEPEHTGVSDLQGNKLYRAYVVFEGETCQWYRSFSEKVNDDNI